MLVVSDDGAGLAPGFSLDEEQKLGLRIVRTLATRELSGEFSLNSDGTGTEARTKFPY